MTSGVRRVGGEIYFLVVKINAYFGVLSNWGEVTSRWRDLLKGPVSTMVQYCSRTGFHLAGVRFADLTPEVTPIG